MNCQRKDHTVTLPNGNTLTRAVTRDPHRRHLVTGVTNLFNGAVISSFAYTHDILGRVVSRNGDTFGYNARSELTSALLHTNAYGYVTDPIGNRLLSSINGTETSYTANALNQYTGISTPNSSFPIPNSFDADGNMLSDGVFAYAWDAENRLVSAAPIIPAHGSKRVQNCYDWQHRLVRMDAQIYQGGVWHPHETRTLIYDGWLPVLEITDRADGSSGTTEYFWGVDLSGTEQGAGGVGGLLAVSIDGQYHLPCYDHNGNVTTYISESGTPSAQYLYDAFGNTLEQSGAKAGVFRFPVSTKYFVPETRSYYYGYRFYSPETGRWLNRDPIGEKGGLNLYGFVENNPVSDVDVFGLRPLSPNDVSILNRLEDIAKKSDKPDPEYANALRAVISDMKARIEAVKGPGDPANLRIGTQALAIWADPARSRIYAPTLDRATCSKYVADVITHAGIESSLVPRAGWKPGRRYPSATEWFNATTLGSFRVVRTVQKKNGSGNETTITWGQPLAGREGMREPIFGDIISFEYHVGVYLGSDLYVSATARQSARDNDQPNRVVIHNAPRGKSATTRIYFSPE